MQRQFFPIRGVIEGFYGPFYTFPERIDLIQFIGRHGYNLYVYGPKNDRQHRQRWREAYPAEIMEQFAQTVTIAHAAGVTFCYAISPIDYDPARDFVALTGKLHSLYACGVRAFSLLVDDIACTAHRATDCAICQEGSNLHAQVCNQLLAWLHTLDPECSLSMCPTYYHGSAPFGSYLHDLGAQLDPAIAVFYTGPEICSPTISAEQASTFAEPMRRKPLIWDNYPVNDLAMRPNLHLGPIRGRDAALHEAVGGVVVNLMLQAEASKIALLTFADYFADPYSYAPWQSWERALHAVGGPGSFTALRAFAENSLASCLTHDEPALLSQLTEAALSDLKGGAAPSGSTAVQRLAQQLNELDEHCYFLKYRMTNLRLRENVLPWIETLEDWIWLGKHSLTLLDLVERDQHPEQRLHMVEESLALVGRQTRQIAGAALLPLALYALEHAHYLRMHRAQPLIDEAILLSPLELADLDPTWRVPESSTTGMQPAT
ncbi:MAG: beta-N-acetylglucosaminidase domain-containing protein [Chloroflexi bacterium]|nr:beta-N-acetylglucosaminidase domain-containing protein [Chloroflexota bacterium]